jgi:uracil-DNA glycosylase
MTNKPYYDALGIRRYLRTDEQSIKAQTQPVLAPPTTADWQRLQEQVRTCTACPLHQSRTNAVFGVGNSSADLMVIGEAPGFYEDQEGEPFIGRAGKLLDKMLNAISLTRKQVYIANVIKCRPPNNRDPQANEIATCTPYLDQQIMYVKPKLLLALGRIAAHYLVKTKASLDSLRQKVHIYGHTQTPVIITYHPAYLLRNVIDKKKAYADLLFAQKNLGEIINGNISATNNETLPRNP